jgi:hypothetical protein
MALTVAIGSVPCEMMALTDRDEEPVKDTQSF